MDIIIENEGKLNKKNKNLLPFLAILFRSLTIKLTKFKIRIKKLKVYQNLTWPWKIKSQLNVRIKNLRK